MLQNRRPIKRGADKTHDSDILVAKDEFADPQTQEFILLVAKDGVLEPQKQNFNIFDTKQDADSNESLLKREPIKEGAV